jgi:hypothetical protein
VQGHVVLSGGYIDVTEGSRAMLHGVPGGVHGRHGRVQGHAELPGVQYGVIKGSWAMLGCPVGYMVVRERSRVMLGYLVCYTGVMEGTWAMPGCPVGYMDVTESSRAMPGCPVC